MIPVPPNKLDPRIKQAIKFALEDAIYSNTIQRHLNNLRHISEKNMVLCRLSHNSFSYKGIYYNFELVPLRYKNQRLLVDLHPLMDKELKAHAQINQTERPYVVGLFNKVLNMTNSIYDYYELLPDVLHRAIQSLNIAPEYLLPRELTDEQVAAFKSDHQEWLLMLKKRMILDLVTT